MAPRRMAPRRMAQMFGADGCPRDVKPWRMGPPFHGFSFQAHPSVPLVLAFPVSQTDHPETDDPQTDVAETENPETDVVETEVPETDDPETDVPETPKRMSPRRMTPRDGRCALLPFCMVSVAATV